MVHAEKKEPDPLFIVFEGIDGSGKSTQAEMLHALLKSRGIDAVRLAEPTGGKWGMEIRKMLRGDIVLSGEEQLEYFIKDREDDIQRNIIPAMRKKITIIMDRYYYSNAAYQGAAGLSPEHIIRENKKRGFPEPDRVYLIDIDPETALRRIDSRTRGGREIFEKRVFLERVREIYRSLADEKFFLLDGSGSPEGIFSIIRKDFEKIVKSRS